MMNLRQVYRSLMDLGATPSLATPVRRRSGQTTRFCCALVAGCLILALATVSAQAQPKKKKGKRNRGRNPFGNVMAKLDKLGLTDEQKTKAQAIIKEYRPQLADLRKAGGLTSEQKKARSEAVAKAKADGLKGQDLRKAVQGAVQLTDAQKDAMKKVRNLQREVNQKIMALLTDEQKAKIREGRGKSGGRKKKKGSAERRKRPGRTKKE